MLSADEITTGLRAFADRCARRLEGLAEVSAPQADGDVEGFLITPVAEQAVAVSVMYDAEGICVALDRCPGWELPRELASLAILDEIVSACIAGRVEIGVGRGVRSYRVSLRGGAFLDDATEGVVAFLLSMPWKPRLRWRSSAPYT